MDTPLLLLVLLLYVFVLRLIPLPTYGVVGDGNVVEPTEVDRPAEFREVRPGGDGIKGTDICVFDRGTFEPRIIWGD